MSTDHWQRVRLADIAEVRLGRQRSPKRAVGPHMRPYMRAANVTWSGISLHDVKSMDFTPAEFETYALRPGDILLAEASGSASEVGKPAVWKGEVADCCFQNTLIRVRVHGDLVRFLHLHFQKDALTGAFARASRGVGIFHLGAKSVSDWTVQIPPLGEQHQIADAIDSYFTRLDDAIATLERVQRNLERYRASVLKSAVEGRLVPTEAELARAEGRDYEPASALLERILTERRRRWEEAEVAKMEAKGKPPKNDKWKAKYKEPTPPQTCGLHALPEGWCWCSIDQLLTEPLTNGRSVKTAETGFPVLRLTSLRDGRLDLRERKTGEWTAEEARPFLVRQHDFFVSRGNGSIRLVGSGGLVEARPDPVAFPDTMIRFRVSREFDPRLFALLWNSRALRTQLEAKAKTTAGIYKVNQSDLESCVIPLPPTREQERLRSAIELAITQAKATQRDVDANASKCTRLRQSILKWAFEGRLVDQDPSDEPAFALLERISNQREAAASNRPERKTRSGKKPTNARTDG